MASPRRGSGAARPAGAATQSLGSTTPRLWRNISSRRWMLDRPRQARGEPPESLPWWNVPRKMVRALGYDLAFALHTRDAAAQVSCASDGFSSVHGRHHAGRQLRVSTANAVRGVAVVCGHATCRRGHCAKVQQPVPVTNLRRRKRILRKLAARPSMRAIRMLGYSLSKVWRNMFRGVVVEEGGLDRLRQFLSAQRVVVRGPRRNNTAVVYLPTHKSHIDYLLLSYVCFGYDLPLPHIAAGNNLDLPVVGKVLSNAGAFFIRRSFRGDAEYRDVLMGYLFELVRTGRALEFFAEGGRSRHGTVAQLKLGLIGMLVECVWRGAVGDVVVVPIGLDYDRVPEAGSHASQLLGHAKTPESIGALLSAAGSLLNRNHGCISVRFGEPVSLRGVMDGIWRSSPLDGEPHSARPPSRSPQPPPLPPSLGQRRTASPSPSPPPAAAAPSSTTAAVLSPCVGSLRKPRSRSVVTQLDDAGGGGNDDACVLMASAHPHTRSNASPVLATPPRARRSRHHGRQRRRSRSIETYPSLSSLPAQVEVPPSPERRSKSATTSAAAAAAAAQPLTTHAQRELLILPPAALVRAVGAVLWQRLVQTTTVPATALVCAALLAGARDEGVLISQLVARVVTLHAVVTAAGGVVAGDGGGLAPDAVGHPSAHRHAGGPACGHTPDRSVASAVCGCGGCHRCDVGVVCGLGGTRFCAYAAVVRSLSLLAHLLVVFHAPVSRCHSRDPTCSAGVWSTAATAGHCVCGRCADGAVHVACDAVRLRTGSPAVVVEARFYAAQVSRFLAADVLAALVRSTDAIVSGAGSGIAGTGATAEADADGVAALPPSPASVRMFFRSEVPHFPRSEPSRGGGGGGGGGSAVFLQPPPPPPSLPRPTLLALAAPFLDAAWCVAVCLQLVLPPQPPVMELKSFVSKCQTVGHHLFAQGRLECAEAITTHAIRSALTAWQDCGVVRMTTKESTNKRGHTVVQQFLHPSQRVLPAAHLGQHAGLRLREAAFQKVLACRTPPALVARRWVSWQAEASLFGGKRHAGSTAAFLAVPARASALMAWVSREEVLAVAFMPPTFFGATHR